MTWINVKSKQFVSKIYVAKIWHCTFLLCTNSLLVVTSSSKQQIMGLKYRIILYVTINIQCLQKKISKYFIFVE